MIMIKRTIEKKVRELINVFPVVLISGPRQVGKSTLAYKFKEQGFSYVSLDDLNMRASANADPVQFIKSFQLPLIIDEVQYEPKLFDVIESIVNKTRLEKGSANGLFILTGSQEIKLEKGIESMAGRVAVIHMYGLSLSEIHGVDEIQFKPSLERSRKRINNYKISKDMLYEVIVRGSYPELYRQSQLKSDDFYNSYVQTYIERDVKEIIEIKDKILFQNFLRYMASLTGQELVISTISKALGIRNETVNAWLSVLTATKIIYLLQPYNELSLTRRIVKRPKIYFTDTGLAAYLARLSDAKNLSINRFAGAFAETFMMNEVMKSYTNNGLTFPAFYYRDKNQNEIDLVLVEKGEINLIEFKEGMSFTKKDVTTFKLLNDSKLIKSTNAIICLTEEPYSLDKDIYVLPIQTI